MSGLKSNLQESDSEDEPEFLQYKLVILGDGTVGKTSLCVRLCESEFQMKYKQTIGLDFFVKRLELPNNTHVALQIWDIGGQSIGSKMLSTYIYGADAVLLVYDITNYQSFVNLEEWFQVVKDTFKSGTLPYIALMGNKTDLFHMQAVKMEKHNGMADQHSLYSYLVSAKTGDQVFNTFFRIAADLSGVVLTTEQVEASQPILRPEVVNYSNTPSHETPQVSSASSTSSPAPQPRMEKTQTTAPVSKPPPPPAPAKKKKCLIF